MGVLSVSACRMGVLSGFGCKLVVLVNKLLICFLKVLDAQPGFITSFRKRSLIVKFI